MGKGLSKHWTPEQEAHFQRLVESTTGFAGERLYVALAIKFGLSREERTRVTRRDIKGDNIRIHTAP